MDAAATERALRTIERNARAQAQIVDDLLDMSKIITGRLNLSIEPVEPACVIDAADDAVRPAANAKEIRLECNLDRSVNRIAFDKVRLHQVIWNLLSNAVKFTEEQGWIKVSLARTGDVVRITVEDNGRGISPAVLPHMFERFRQADGSSTRQYGGLGLGLAIVRHLNELHGGTVSADSPGEGHGSTFTVTLPHSGRISS
jgi:signal transduction histidine kinase